MPPGVYALCKIISETYMYLDDEKDEHCYNRLTVDAEFLKIDYCEPFIDKKVFSKFNNQFRTPHVIDEIYYDNISSHLSYKFKKLSINK